MCELLVLFVVIMIKDLVAIFSLFC